MRWRPGFSALAAGAAGLGAAAGAGALVAAAGAAAAGCAAAVVGAAGGTGVGGAGGAGVGAAAPGALGVAPVFGAAGGAGAPHAASSAALAATAVPRLMRPRRDTFVITALPLRDGAMIVFHQRRINSPCETDTDSRGKTMRESGMNVIRPRIRLIALSAVVCAAVFLVVYYSPVVPEVSFWSMGLRREPTREDHLRDCPRLPSSVHFDYQMSHERQKPILLIIYVDPPDARLPDELDATILSRQGGQIGLRVPLKRTCDLANLSIVVAVQEASPPRPSSSRIL